MKKYLPLLKKSNMFSGVSEEEIEAMLSCLSAKEVLYKKNEFIIRGGEQIHSIGMILSGSALIIKEDFWGNRTIISEVSPGSSFGESYACLSYIPMESSVIAKEDTLIMLFDMKKILSVCTSACSHHTRLIQNLLATIAKKNISLTKKMEHMSKRTIRDKLLSYLSAESLKSNSSTFDIPFNRQQLADYLSVDRSALSNEISKLQADGIISCKKNEFTLIQDYIE